MALVSVPVLKALTYQGRSYVRGERVRMPAIDAAVHARRGEVTLTVGAVVTRVATRELSAESEQAPAAVRTRRQYRRRDMTAEAPPSQD